MAFEEIPKHITALFQSEFENNFALHQFMAKYNLHFNRLLAYGKAAWILLLKDNKGIKFTIKLEKKKSTRNQMVEKEAKYLAKANKLGIGQKLLDLNLNARCLLWKYLDAEPLKKWIKKKQSKQKIKKMIKSILQQAQKLDDAGLDHGQLAGDATNIMVDKNGNGFIVDFEKASDARKAHNYNVVKNFLLNKNGTIGQKIAKQLN